VSEISYKRNHSHKISTALQLSGVANVICQKKDNSRYWLDGDELEAKP